MSILNALSKVKRVSQKALEGAAEAKDKMNRDMDTMFGRTALRGDYGISSDRTRRRVALKSKNKPRTAIRSNSERDEKDKIKIW